MVKQEEEAHKPSLKKEILTVGNTIFVKGTLVRIDNNETSAARKPPLMHNDTFNKTANISLDMNNQTKLKLDKDWGENSISSDEEIDDRKKYNRNLNPSKSDSVLRAIKDMNKPPPDPFSKAVQRNVSI